MTKVPAGLAPAAFDHFEQFSVVISDTLYRLAGVRSYLKLCHKANGPGIQAAPLLNAQLKKRTDCSTSSRRERASSPAAG
jgi:hypothetical protein